MADIQWLQVARFFHKFGSMLELDPKLYSLSSLQNHILFLDAAAAEQKLEHPNVGGLFAALLKPLDRRRGVKIDTWKKHLVAAIRDRAAYGHFQFVTPLLLEEYATVPQKHGDWDTDEEGEETWEPIPSRAYIQTPYRVRVSLLWELLHLQFDENVKFIKKLRDSSNISDAIDLREEPLGIDRVGREYWFLMDTAADILLARVDPVRQESFVDAPDYIKMGTDNELRNIVDTKSTTDSTMQVCSASESGEIKHNDSDEPLVAKGIGMSQTPATLETTSGCQNDTGAMDDHTAIATDKCPNDIAMSDYTARATGDCPNNTGAMNNHTKDEEGLRENATESIASNHDQNGVEVLATNLEQLEQVTAELQAQVSQTRMQEATAPPVAYDDLLCTACKTNERDDCLLLCDANHINCALALHTYCLDPPLSSLPPEGSDWYCPSCVLAKKEEKLVEALVSDIVPQVNQVKSKLERQARRAVAQQKQLSRLLGGIQALSQMDDGSKRQRSARVRSGPDYTGAAFDDAISASIRENES